MSRSSTVLLVNPSLWAGYRGTVLGRFVEVLPPQNLAAIAASLRDAGHRVHICDLNLEGDRVGVLRRALERVRPDHVGTTMLSPQEQDAAEVLQLTRTVTPSATTWLGGVGPTVDPQGVAERLRPDALVIGEADHAMAESLAAGERGQVPGVAWVHADGHIELPETRELIDDLDELPLPALDLVDSRDYRRGLRGRRGAAAPIETSRGCVYLCTFCTKAVFGGGFRVKSPERVVVEMQRIRDLGYHEAVVYDDTFNLSMRRARAICDRLIAAGAPIPWNCRVGIRADRVDADLLVKMRRAGCYRASFGVESGDQEVLDAAKKGTKVEQVERAFRLAREAGIETMAFFVIALPAETVEGMRATAELATRIDPNFAKFNVFMPLPSTPDWQEMQEQGLLAPNAIARINFHRVGEGWRHPTLSVAAIRRGYLRAYLRFYTNPRRLLRAARAFLRGPGPWIVPRYESGVQSASVLAAS